jgi:hypothetical protein
MTLVLAVSGGWRVTWAARPLRLPVDASPARGA